MRNRTTFAIGLFIAGLSAIGTAQAQGLSDMDKMFLKTLSQGNHAEIGAGKIALKNAADTKVKGVAQTIIAGHTKNQAQLDALATKVKVAVPHAPDAKHKAEAKKLAALKGTAFDNAYITGQMRDHMATIALLRKEMEVGKSSEVRSFATMTLGDVQAHTDTIYKVAGASSNEHLSKMGGMGAAGGKPKSGTDKMGGKMGSNKMSGSMASPKPPVSPMAGATPAPGIN